MRRTLYHIAGESLVIEAQDPWIADEIEARFAGWYLSREGEASDAMSPAIVMSSRAAPPALPGEWDRFDIAGGGVCHTDGRASYLDLDGAVIAIGRPGRAGVEVWVDAMPPGDARIGAPIESPLDASALTRVVSYALSAALRQRRRFELHSGALVDPETGKGVLIVGPSGSGKSTLAVHLAAAGWPFLTDDVLLLSHERGDRPDVTAWPLRRCFAITAETLAASRFLRTRSALEPVGKVAAVGAAVGAPVAAAMGATVPRIDDKQQFLPQDVFAGPFTDRCVPGTLVFAEVTGARDSRVSPLSASETMARLIRMNPWSCYDRATAADHLAVLSALATQATAYALRAGRDLLDSDAAVATIAACTRAS